MKITLEEVKNITNQLPREKELTYGEIQTIQAAANGDALDLICHAYALGFTRGSQAIKQA